MSLNDADVELLQEIVQRRCVDRFDLLGAVTAREFSPSQRTELCEVIGLEFAEAGLDSEDEPTAYGIRLESLLDEINRPNLK